MENSPCMRRDSGVGGHNKLKHQVTRYLSLK